MTKKVEKRMFYAERLKNSRRSRVKSIALASGDDVGLAMPLRNTMKRFGVETAPLSEWAKYETTVFQKACEYSRRNGLKVIQPAFVAPIPNEFRDKYPDANYIEHSELRCLASYDPLFSEVTKAFIEEYNKIYGTDNYVNADPYPEESPGETEEEKARIKFEFAQQSVSRWWPDQCTVGRNRSQYTQITGAFGPALAEYVWIYVLRCRLMLNFRNMRPHNKTVAA